jgi:hypothetical protein
MLKMQQPLSPARLGQGKVTEYRYPPGCSSETSGEVTSILPFFKSRMTGFADGHGSHCLAAISLCNGEAQAQRASNKQTFDHINE